MYDNLGFRENEMKRKKREMIRCDVVDEKRTEHFAFVVEISLSLSLSLNAE